MSYRLKTVYFSDYEEPQWVATTTPFKSLRTYKRAVDPPVSPYRKEPGWRYKPIKREDPEKFKLNLTFSPEEQKIYDYINTVTSINRKRIETGNKSGEPPSKMKKKRRRAERKISTSAEFIKQNEIENNSQEFSHNIEKKGRISREESKQKCPNSITAAQISRKIQKKKNLCTAAESVEVAQNKIENNSQKSSPKIKKNPSSSRKRSKQSCDELNEVGFKKPDKKAKKQKKEENYAARKEKIAFMIEDGYALLKPSSVITKIMRDILSIKNQPFEKNDDDLPLKVDMSDIFAPEESSSEMNDGFSSLNLPSSENNDGLSPKIDMEHSFSLDQRSSGMNNSYSALKNRSSEINDDSSLNNEVDDIFSPEKPCEVNDGFSSLKKSSSEMNKSVLQKKISISSDDARSESKVRLMFAQKLKKMAHIPPECVDLRQKTLMKNTLRKYNSNEKPR